MDTTSPSTVLESVFNHVVLPPRLPGKQDPDPSPIQNGLISRMIDASRTLRDLATNHDQDDFDDHWDRLRRLLQTCKTINANGTINKAALLTEFRTLQPKDLLILHIAEQNAGLLIRRDHDVRADRVIFEAYEAAALSEKVLASESALRWDFPGSTVALPYVDFADSSFQENLAAFLEQSSAESIKRFAARTNKAGSSAFESRDSVDPCLISQMLTTLIEVNGYRTYPPLLRKRIRDDVCWTEGAMNPWRRCPIWLVLRVAIQRHLCTLLGGEAGRVHYKFLMCLVLARLLEDSLGQLSPELVTLLKAKLCRRLVKLEVDRDRAPHSIRATYEDMFTNLGPLFRKTTRNATEHVKAAWTAFKKTIRRPIAPLPRRAAAQDLQLTLPNSGLYLQEALTEFRYSYNAPQSSAGYDISAVTAKHIKDFSNRYFSLSKIETEIESSHVALRDSTTNLEGSCMKIAKNIDTYLTAVGDSYESNPQEKSIMLLTVMELWVAMDEHATTLFPLLKDYDPGFPAEILDVLQLPRFQDMRRLQTIQLYLHDRHKTSGSRMTIFDDPVKGCFAERYFDESEDSSRLKQLHQRIETDAKRARARKEKEWQRLSEEYEGLVRTSAESTCLYTTDDSWPPVQVHDDRGCTKCYLQRKARRIRIQVHEHPLPSNLVHAKAVVFELGCPKAFTTYRDATWKIFGTLARPKHVGSVDPKMLLRDYSELQPYLDSNMGVLSLASTTKSFLTSHYSNVRFPVRLDDVCLPNGLKVGYFDSLARIWPARQKQKPTFAHHCRMVMSANSPFSSLAALPEFAVDAAGISSYAVVESQTRVPPGINVHEFMAYQTLFSGENRRWPIILLELGSSNLNFSTEATTMLLSRLALQAGPMHKADPLRIIHRIFRDTSFCERLTEQLSQRLKGISSNWRETQCMEMLVTLILRLCSIASEPIIIRKAIELLEAARAITLKWISLLRVEIHRATDADTSRRCSRYAFWAALLCRRTFALYAEAAENLQSPALRCFIECSIVLQDSLAGDPAALPAPPRNALIRDLKMVSRMRFVLRRSLDASPDSLTSAIDAFWPQPDDIPRSSAAIKFLPPPNEWWVKFTVKGTDRTMQQTVHYHLLEGHLMINGQSLGRLPAEHRNSVILTQLFGNQSLLTYPSGMCGMRYVLAVRMYGHQIHLGFRDGKIIVRARVRDTVLELVPPEMFGNPSNFDLPASLVEKCVHWLDLNTGFMEIRKQPDIWKFKSSNWCLDLQTRVARRRTSSLVDPHCALFQQVFRALDRFEERSQITVYQPATKSLSVELRRLELSFFVNSRNLLESSQLRSEIDPNQDAGTFYGLNSKIVLRDVSNPRQRSVIVPMGPMSYRRNGFHVAVDIANRGDYARFTINDVLGRLDCPAEPLLLYLKAQLHAYTSFVVPDPLSNRTGTEEALHCLTSGYCQPWTPLHSSPHGCLVAIAKLTPKRCYYPNDLHVMQKVLWDPHLTTTIQHDGFRSIIDAICRKSNQLSLFAFQSTELPSLERAGDPHLTHRSCARRRLYERPSSDCNGEKAATDLSYDARDRCRADQKRTNVFESVSLIRTRPSKMPSTSDLAGILQTWPTIGGHHRIFDKLLLSDLLSLELALEWGALVELCRMAEAKEKYRLMFLFAVMSFRDDVDMEIIRVLIGFSVLEDLKPLVPPKWPSYTQFRENQIPHIDYILQLIRPCCEPYPGDERGTVQLMHAKQRSKLGALEIAHQEQAEKDCKSLAQFFLKQWPCADLTIEGFSELVLVDISRALEIIRPEWQRLFQNLELSRYLHQVQSILDCHRTDERIEQPNVNIEDREVLPTRCRGGEFPALSRDLLRKTGPSIPTELYPILTNETKHYNSSLVTLSVSPEIRELEMIIRGLPESPSIVRQQYGRDLMQSLNALKIKGTPTEAEAAVPSAKLSAELSRAREVVQEHFAQLCKSFERHDSRVQWLQEGGLWPCVTPVTLLEQLRSTSLSVFGQNMKEGIITYALSVTSLQRLMRIEDAHRKRNHQKLREEQHNKGHENWRPLEHPDWLLLEIDANILIRHDQVDVALATICPASESNSVLQMNMGQGKTSCIIPMVAAVLADAKKLLRVVVPKPLLLQTAQLLHARLGGLVGREVTHVPFSRKTPTKTDIIKQYYDIHKEALRSAGVMLALPEHILSFMLSGLQRLSDARTSEAHQMIKVQDWTRRKCRDVLDECDFTLDVRTQLIYPSGSQRVVDGHPHRWETAEALLRLVESHLWNLQCAFPHSIEVYHRPQGGFPIIFFLRQDVEDALLARLIDDICGGRTSILPTRDCPQSDRLAIKKFISDAKVQQSLTERIRQMFLDNLDELKKIYLLRGLLTHRILLLTLKKRWNVQYGLHPQRAPIAVPYHAKGVPSDQAEWGHSDVAILFTCLAFYYGGLDVAQLRQSLEHVLQADDPSSQFDRWTHSSESLPDSLREWNAINVDDEAQLMEIWRHVRYNVTVIDYYLNNFVFPKHAKQFQMKLQASGWDIPLLSADNSLATRQENSRSVGKTSQVLTTGFSGTNDNRTMLPLTIKQEDLPRLSHTNAEVLTYLLQARNRKYVLAADVRGKHLAEIDLLRKLSVMEIRIFIDAGAQILEMDNLSLVKAWLEVFPRAPAAVYFDAENKPWVLYRHGHRIPLLASPFVDNLDDCLVYLDQAHTRGTDLKMPADARGALTLGLGQSKDHTLQAAMRLRQLANSQSIVFFAPPEVHQSILDLRKKTSGDRIDSCDVICWLLEQTIDGLEQLQPLYFSQGADFCRRTQAASDNPDFLVDTTQRDAYLNALRQTEHQTLEQLYEPKVQSKTTKTIKTSVPELARFMKELNTRRKGFQDTGKAVHGSALQEVEQEREVAFEVEAVREVQKPVHYSPFTFPGLHRDILNFVKTGRVAAGSVGYEQAFITLRKTGLGRKYGINSQATASRLYVSTEFTRTVKLPGGRLYDNFQRQVNWILWSVVTETALIIIPEEAELVLPMVRSASPPITHLLTYAAPVTRKMLHFNDLKYYTVPELPAEWKAPTWLTIELGIFAGRLYFEWEEYDDLRKYLGLREAATKLEEMTDGAVTPTESDERESAAEDATDDETGIEPTVPRQAAQSFTSKPLTFLQEWLAVRRKGQDFAHTPMGYVCQGKPLTANHPFFTRAENDAAVKADIDVGTEERMNPFFHNDLGSDEDIHDDNDYDDDVDDVDYYDGEEGEQNENEDFGILHDSELDRE